jgi:hypothetical protein
MAVTFTQSNSKIYRKVAIDSTGVSVKASAGVLHGWSVYSEDNVNEYVKIYDKATAATSTDTPVLTLGSYASAANHLGVPGGIKFSNGISVRATALVADDNATDPTARMTVNLFYV